MRTEWEIDLFEGATMDAETPPSHGFRVESQGGITIVRFDDIQIGPDSREALYGLAEDERHTKIVLDLSDVWALSSLALGILANFQQRVEAKGGRLKLCGLNANLKQLFRMTKLDQIFNIHETQKEAVEDFVRA
jgi:anti-sigma B factor antagonist